MNYNIGDNMKKNTFYRLYSAAFIGICLVPAVCMPFVKADSSKEKRRLAELPKIKTEEGKINTEFFSQFDDWFSEHFAFRQQMVTADGRLMASALGTSPNKDVIVGSDGWLYYGETANDYLRSETLSQQGIRNIVHNLDLIENYCKSIGSEFIFTCAPNKNTLYPEHMPKNYVPAHKMSTAHQAPPSLGFSKQEHWSGLPFPSPGDLPNPGIEPRSPTLQADALTSAPPEKPHDMNS